MGEIKYNGKSYSGLIQANGCFIDPSRIIVNSAYTSNLSYTATEDCYIYVNVALNSNTGGSCAIDGDNVASWWNGSGGTVAETYGTYLRKGQTFTATASNPSSSAYIVYGLLQGSNITFLSEYASACYDTNEREVGCWVDGKPLYQKTYSGLSISCPSQGVWYSTGQNYGDIENIVFCEIIDQYGQRISGSAGYMSQTPKPIALNLALDNRVVKAFTLQYTKTTDTAGSGQFAPTGLPTHHYSTNEQIVGTWIDGKPIYEITLNPTVAVGSNTVAHGIANLKECISIKGKCKFDNGSDVLPLPYVSTNIYYMIALGNVNATNYLIDVGSYFGSIQDCYVTIQYTKTTD